MFIRREPLCVCVQCICYGYTIVITINFLIAISLLSVIYSYRKHRIEIRKSKYESYTFTHKLHG